MNSSTNVPLASRIEETEEPVKAIEPTVIDLDKDYSYLPEGTQASLQLDKKTQNGTTPLPSQPVLPTKKPKKGNSKKMFRSLLFSLLGISLCGVIFLIMSVTNIDTQIFGLNLNGKVIDELTQNPIENVTISFNQKTIATTDKSGNYSASGLPFGQITVTVSAPGYNSVESTINLSKVLLDYSNRKDFILRGSQTGSIKGKFIASDSDYKFTNQNIIINQKEYSINPDGSFEIKATPIGPTTLEFKSILFKDINSQIEVKVGENLIPDTLLIEAGDVVGELKSYITEDLVLNTKFFVENVLQTQVTITDKGEFALTDLEVGRTYSIRVVAEGYQSRDYSIKINSGENKLFNFKLVEQGSAFYPKKVNNSIKIFKSDFDGSNSTIFLDDRNVEPKTMLYSIDKKLLYFQSNKDSSLRQVSGGGALNLPYSIDSQTNLIDRLTVQTTKLGNLIPNFTALKMLSIYKKADAQNKFTMEVLDINGTNPIEVKMIENQAIQFNDYAISNNGSSVVYSYNNNNTTSLYQFNIQSKETKLLAQGQNIKLFDVSSDGSQVITSKKNDSTGLVDLILINTESAESRTIKENFKGSEYQFIKGSKNIIIFFETRNQRSDIFKFIVDQNKEERVTDLTPDYTISDIYQESNLTFYITNRGLLVLDINKPKSFKVVDAEVVPSFYTKQ